jgi:hypothetical protein
MILKGGILVLAFVIFWERFVVQEHKYTPSIYDPSRPDVPLPPTFTELLSSEGKLAAEGWSINHPGVKNTQANSQLSALQKRNINFV